MDSGVKPIDPAELLGRGSSRSLALDEPNAITLRHKTRGRDFSLPLPGPDRHKILHTSKNVKTGGKVIRTDVLIAKNYLSKEEIDTLNRLVSMYLDMAELRARKHVPMTMEDWEKRLDSFLVFNDMGILQGPGSVSAQEAKEHALGEFEKFRIRQDHEFRNAFDVRIAADRLLDDARKMVKDED